MPMRLARTTGSRLRGVAVHDHGAENAAWLVRNGSRIHSRSCAHLRRRRHPRPQPGMHEDVAADPVHQAEAAQEAELARRDALGPGARRVAPAELPARQRLAAAVAQPGRGGGRARRWPWRAAACPRGCPSGSPPPAPRRRSGTANGCIRWRITPALSGPRSIWSPRCTTSACATGRSRQVLADPAVHVLQPIQAAMHVADGVNALIRRQAGGC